MHPRVCPKCLHGGIKQTLSDVCVEGLSRAMQHHVPVGDEASSWWTQTLKSCACKIATSLDYAETLVAKHYYAFHLDLHWLYSTICSSRLHVKWDRCQPLGLTTAVFCIFKTLHCGCYFNNWWKKTTTYFIRQCGWFTKKASFMHQKAGVYVLRVLPYHSNEKDGFTLFQRWMLLRKWHFFFFLSTKEGVQILWSFILASAVVSCDGVLCVKEVGASVQQGRLYKLLADFILIYDFLFPMTYSIFISYIYLFREYIFAGMKLNKKREEKSRKRHRGFSSFSVLCKCYICIHHAILLGVL